MQYWLSQVNGPMRADNPRQHNVACNGFQKQGMHRRVNRARMRVTSQNDRSNLIGHANVQTTVNVSPAGKHIKGGPVLAEHQRLSSPSTTTSTTFNIHRLHIQRPLSDQLLLSAGFTLKCRPFHLRTKEVGGILRPNGGALLCPQNGYGTGVSLGSAPLPSSRPLAVT
jgi:hypothetical protein